LCQQAQIALDRRVWLGAADLRRASSCLLLVALPGREEVADQLGSLLQTALFGESGFEPLVPLLRMGLPGVAEGKSWKMGPVLSSDPLRETSVVRAPSPQPFHSPRDRDFEAHWIQRRVAVPEEAQFARPLGPPIEENCCRPGRSIRLCASGVLRKPLPPWPRRQPQSHASTALPQRRRPSFPRCGQARSRYGPSPAQ